MIANQAELEGVARAIREFFESNDYLTRDELVVILRALAWALEGERESEADLEC
jgi:hypothetical protein